MEPKYPLLCSQGPARLSQINPAHIFPHSIRKIQPITIFSPILGLLTDLFNTDFQQKYFMYFLMPRPSIPPSFDHPNNIFKEYIYKAPQYAVFSSS
jgi:hypothetical protein